MLDFYRRIFQCTTGTQYPSPYVQLNKEKHCKLISYKDPFDMMACTFYPRHYEGFVVDLCGQMAKLVYFPVNRGVNILDTNVGQLADVTQTGRGGGGGLRCRDEIYRGSTKLNLDLLPEFLILSPW